MNSEAWGEGGWRCEPEEEWAPDERVEGREGQRARQKSLVGIERWRQGRKRRQAREERGKHKNVDGWGREKGKEGRRQAGRQAD